MNSWVRHYMVQDKEELIGMLLSRDKAIKLFEKKLHSKDKEISRLNNIINEFDKYLKEQFDIYKELDKIQDSRISCQLLIARERLNELREDK